MTLEEVRAGIDAVDTQMKPLFLKRMECGKHVAEVKAQTGGDVFVLERELEIIEKRATDVDPEIQEEYKTFLRHLMSLCRKYEYELLPEMQEKVMTAALAAAGLTAETEHTQVKIGFTCPKETSDLNLFVNMTKLNGIQIDAMNLMTENGIQKVTMTLESPVLFPYASALRRTYRSPYDVLHPDPVMWNNGPLAEPHFPVRPFCPLY